MGGAAAGIRRNRGLTISGFAVIVLVAAYAAAQLHKLYRVPRKGCPFGQAQELGNPVEVRSLNRSCMHRSPSSAA